MQDKYRILYKISLLSGILPLTGGWLLFLTWLGARHYYAVDLEQLAIIGFFWIIICFFVAIAGLISLLFYVIINARNLHFRMIIAVVVILINIPSVFLILPWHGEEDHKVFIKLLNHSGNNIEHATIIGENSEQIKIGPLTNGESKIFSYEPPYKFMGERIYQLPDSLKLVISSGQNQDTVGFPTFRRGAEHLILDENLKVKSP
jgi:hypothetical protein